MRILFLGCTKFSSEILNYLFDLNVNIVGVCSIPEYFKISYSEELVKNTNYADIGSLAAKKNISHFEVNSEKSFRLTDYSEKILELKVDVILAIGWYYMVPEKIRSLAKYGAWGIHASLLPDYAGGAPLVWAIINGEKETGVTLFKFDNGVDDGDIIRQEKFKIEREDAIKQVYEKATIASKSILKDVFIEKRYSFTPQDKSKIKVYPQRSPKDGEIDWTWDSEKIYNFIRAQSRPYPGAWTIIEGKKITIWDASLKEIDGLKV